MSTLVALGSTVAAGAEPTLPAASGEGATGAVAADAFRVCEDAARVSAALSLGESDVFEAGAPVVVPDAGASGRTIVGLEDVALDDVDGVEVTGDEIVEPVGEGGGTVGRTIVGVLVVDEGTELGEVIEDGLEGRTVVVDGSTVVLVVGLVAEGMLIDGEACWARAGLEPSARTAATAAVAQSERVGAWCVMNTTMRRKSKSYSLTSANPVKTNKIKRRTAFPYAR